MDFFPYSGCKNRNILRIIPVEILVLGLFLGILDMSLPEIQIDIASLPRITKYQSQ